MGEPNFWEDFWTRFWTIKNATVDKDRLSLDEVENLHETDEIVSYRPEKDRFRLEILRPETWDQ